MSENSYEAHNVRVDRAARFHATFAAPGLMRNTLAAAPVQRVVVPHRVRNEFSSAIGQLDGTSQPAVEAT